MSGGDLYTILRRPLVTEKTTYQKEDDNQISFQVHPDANKIEIRRSVEKLLDVKVTSVNTLVYRGKSKRMGRTMGKWLNWKKAVVTLAPGEDVEFFDAIEDLDEFEIPEE
jgi:large subunit ribosomal protein L23